MGKKNNGVKFITRLVILLAVLLGVLYQGYRLIDRQQYVSNHNIISEYINTELDYSNEKLELQKMQLKNFIATSKLYDADRGWLYERLSLIYQAEGDTVMFYDALGKALYYLEKGGDYEHAANIYADLSNFYMVHSEYNMAQQMLDRISAGTDIAALEDYQIKSYLYRLQAILNTYNGDYEDALSSLDKSYECIYADKRGTFYQAAYLAINDIAKARCFYKMERYDECRDIIENYSDSIYLEPTAYVDVTIRDFTIPYYEVALMLNVHDENPEQAEYCFEKFVEKCADYGYRNIAIGTLSYIRKAMPDKIEYMDDVFETEIQTCYENINEDIYTRYAVLIDNQIQYAKQTEYDSYQDTLKSQNDLRNASLVILIAVVVLFILIDVIVQSSSDPLTKVGNRRALNSKLARYNRSRREYSVIMIDIDNFKKVNDTYGHEKGDEVLATLGIILNEEKKVGYTPYRYGGEEFLFLVDSINTGEVVKFADRIRYLMENQVIEGMDEKITISIGVGSRTEGIDDVVRVADDNLYFSKQHGKNVVTFLDDDEPTVYNSFCFKYL